MHFDDYRDSHQGKGDVYDDTILSSPFDAYMDLWEGRHLENILPRLFEGKVPRYLDFACGTGRITRRMELLARDACGVDVSESMLSAARGKCRHARFVCADLTSSDIEPGPFDLVTSFRFFGNAQDDLRDAAMAAIGRRVRPGGYLIINHHRNPRSMLGVAGHRAEGAGELDLTHAMLGALLRRHGFEVVERRAIGFWIFRYRLTTAETLGTRWAAWLERAFQHSWFAPFAPDALLVARKVA